MRRRRPGYILVMTLGLLVLAGTMLVTLSRVSLRRAGEARLAREELQRRWGAVSCRKAMLPQAETILAVAEAAAKKPVPMARTAVRLGGYEFELIISDEQAKANVNAILAVADVNRAQTRIREALAGSGLVNDVKIRALYGPVVTAVSNEPIVGTAPQVSGLGQVLDEVPAGRLIRRAAAGKLAPVELLTCWGTGAVNARRAPAEVLSLAAGRSVTRVEINRLIEARGTGERFRALMGATASESIKNRGNLGLVETSTCHSLWVVTRGTRREWYDLAVLDRSNPDRPVMHTQSW